MTQEDKERLKKLAEMMSNGKPIEVDDDGIWGINPDGTRRTIGYLRFQKKQ